MHTPHSSASGMNHTCLCPIRARSVSSGLLCNFVAVYLTFVPSILQLKLCLYTIVHLLLEEFNLKKTHKSSISTQSFCHTISHRVGVGDPQKSRTPQSTSLVWRRPHRGYGLRRALSTICCMICGVSCLFSVAEEGNNSSSQAR